MIGLKSLKKASKKDIPQGLFINKESSDARLPSAEDDVIDVPGEVVEHIPEKASDTPELQAVQEEDGASRESITTVGETAPRQKKSLKNLFSRKKGDATHANSDAEAAPSLITETSSTVEEGASGQQEPAEPAGLKRRFGARKPRAGQAVAAFTERPVELPVMILMGYLPEVTSKDAMDYALGMAEKYLTQIGMAFFYVTKHDRGYIWEVHEGGPGKAYGPEISTKFGANRLGGSGGTPLKVVLDTATRKVEVSQGVEGLSAVLLPQGSVEQPDTTMIPRQGMTPAIPRRKGLLITGALVLASGVLVSTLAGYFFRVQEFAAAPARQNVVIDAKLLPHLYWKNASLSLRPEDRVRAMRFEKGAWQPMDLYPRVTEPSATQPSSVEPASAPASAAEGSTSSGPAAAQQN